MVSDCAKPKTAMCICSLLHKCEKFYQEFGHIFGKNLCQPKIVLKLMTQSKFDVNCPENGIMLININ